jgi:hypothetical protein
MEQHTSLRLDLPIDIQHALRAKARAVGIAPSVLAQAVLAEALLGPKDTSHAVVEPRQTLLAPIRALLAADLSRAEGWDDLQTRLAVHGYIFRERGGGLALYCTRTAAHTCKASELGWSYADLMRRFGAPFPGHSHTKLANRILPHGPSSDRYRPDLFADPGDTSDDDGEDIILIEPW